MAEPTHLSQCAVVRNGGKHDHDYHDTCALHGRSSEHICVAVCQLDARSSISILKPAGVTTYQMGPKYSASAAHSFFADSA